MKFCVLILLGFFMTLPLSSQNNLLDDERTLNVIYDGLTSMYSYDFDAAEEALAYVSKRYPAHPVTPFFEGLITYWKNYPLIPGQPQAERFTSLMEECIARADKMLTENEDDLEGVFFDLFGRAFYVMFWSDNGKPGKVFPFLNQMYKETLKGFELKDKFNEFYFTCGLYNYYIVAYPENHPVYKPVAMFFKKGNRKLGIKQLQYCAEHSVFLRVEARLFLALIYLNFENDFDTAQEYAASLYKEFPANPYYTGLYLEILLYNSKYFFAPILIDHLAKMSDPFARFQAHLYRGLYQEKCFHNWNKAVAEYKISLNLAKKYGPFADHFNAIAWMGLGRYYKHEGNESQASAYFRKARDASAYDYVIEDK